MSNWTQLGSTINGVNAGDESGRSVSVNATGDIVAIGAPFGTPNGQTRIYKYNGSSWIQHGNFIDGVAANEASGFSVSINSAGNRVVVGAPQNNGPDDNNGQTRVYEYNSGTQLWVQIGQEIDGIDSFGESGTSVSINSLGNRVAIGAPRTDAGSTRVYEFNSISNSWNQLGTPIDGVASGDRSGISVSINSAGNRVAIGAPRNDNLANNSGQTSIYEYDSNSNSWNLVGNHINGTIVDIRSGTSVSINSAGNRVAIGAPRVGNGRTYIYEYDNNSWVLLGTILGLQNGSGSGTSVSINAFGNKVAIGAPFSNGPGVETGSTTVYEYISGVWTQIGDPIYGDVDNGQSGISVSINSLGTRVAAGAPFTDDMGSTSIYEFMSPLVPCFAYNNLLKYELPEDAIIMKKNVINNKWININELYVTKDHLLKINNEIIRSEDTEFPIIEYTDEVADIMTSDGRFININGYEVATCKI